MRYVGLALLAMLGCAQPSADEVRHEATRLRASLEKYQTEYLRSIEHGNRLAGETLRWLRGPAASAPRAEAVAEARRLTRQWGLVYFVPRYMHEQLRFDEYRSQPVREAQQRMLERLKRTYFELHDYQRYAQSASETSMHGAAPGQMPLQLLEFQRRLEARATAVDEITPLLNSLPR